MMGMAGTGMELLLAGGVDAGSCEAVDLDREGADGLDGDLGFGGGAGGNSVEQLLAWLNVVVRPGERGASSNCSEGFTDVVDGIPLAHDPDDRGSARNRLNGGTVRIGEMCLSAGRRDRGND
eukprot:16436839-Heterocapsa_arctica.AAC.1